MIQTGFETRIKVQDIVSSQLPNFILDESPKTIDFLKQYYISQEYQGGPTDLSSNLDQYLNLDNLTPEVIVDNTVTTTSITDSDSVISVSSTKGFPKEYGLLKIDNEIISYTGITNNSFTGCIRGFSGVTSYGTNFDKEELIFSTSSSASHGTDVSVKNLSSLFLKEFFNKFKTTFAPGLENNNFVSSLNVGNFLREIKSFYQSKGTNESFRILFEILYGESPTVVNLEEKLIKPSFAEYRRREVAIAKVISGEGSLLKGQGLFKENSNISASISEISPFSIDNEIFFKLSLFVGYDEDSDIKGRFLPTPNSKCTEDVQVNGTVVNVDSTIGFKNNGKFRVGSNIVSYTDKTVNQFLNCTGITSSISQGNLVYDNEIYFGYENGDVNKKVEMVFFTTIDNFVQKGTVSVNENDPIGVKNLGDKVINPTQDKSSKQILANSWIYNTNSSYFIKNFNNSTLELFSPIDKSSLKVGDFVEIVERNTGTVVFPDSSDSNKPFIDINGQEIQGETSVTLSGGFAQSIINANVDYNLRKILNKSSIGSNSNVSFKYGNESLISDIQNVYFDEEYAYVASNSLPSSATRFEKSGFPLSEDIDVKIKKLTLDLDNNTGGILTSFNNLTQTFDAIKVLDVDKSPFRTGDKVFYKPETDVLVGLETGIYFVEVLGDNDEIKLYGSNYLIGTDSNISLSSVGGTHTFVLDSQKSGLIGPQKLLKKFPINQNIVNGQNEETIPGGVGLLINGVEITNYKSTDKVYYGPLERVNVLNGGENFDVINPPKIVIESGLGNTALSQPVVTGSVKDVFVDFNTYNFNISKVVSIGVTGGNGTGCILKPSITNTFREIQFDGRPKTSGGGINTVTSQIVFDTPHGLVDGQEIIYDSNFGSLIGITSTANSNNTTLVNKSTYIVNVPNVNTVELFRNNDDFVAGTNKITFSGLQGSGNQKLKVGPLNVLKDIVVIDGGKGYTNKKLIVKPSKVSLNYNWIEFENHGFNDGELIDYSIAPGDGVSLPTVISGLSTDKKYQILKLDNNKFRVCDAGIGGTIVSNFERKNYIKFTSSGTGYQQFSYPKISVDFKFITAGIGETTVTITPVVKGSISSVDLYEKGTGYGSSIINYENSPTISIQNGKSARVTPLVSNGRIISVNVEYAGEDYYSTPDIIVTDASKSGSGAILRSVIKNNKLDSVEVIKSGIGYSSADTSISVISSGSNLVLESKVRNLTLVTNEIFNSNKLLLDNDNNELKYSVCGYDVDLFSDDSTSISDIIGWAYDGNPIYGPFGSKDPNTFSSPERLLSGYKKDSTIVNDRPSLSDFSEGIFVEDYYYDTANADLDEHNGRYEKNKDFPNGVYAYHAVIKQDNIPVFPFFVGNTYRSKKIKENFQSDFNQSYDFNNSTLQRNTFPYNVNEKFADNFFIKIKKDQKIVVDKITSGSIEDISIVNEGTDFKVNDIIKFNNTDTKGSGLNVKVSSVTGEKIESVDTVKEEYNNSVLIWGGDTIKVALENEHEFKTGDYVSLSGISTDSLKNLEKYHRIVVENDETSRLISPISAGAATTEIYPSFIPNYVSTGSTIGIGDESLTVLNIFKDSNILRVERGDVSIAHTESSLVNYKTKSFTFDSKVPYFNSTINTKVYFNAAESVGLGTQFGIGFSTSFIFGESTIFREIPTKGIYLENHPFETNQLIKLTNPVGADIIQYSVDPDSSLLTLSNGNYYVVNKSKNVVGLKTGIGDNFKEIYFRGFTSGGGSDNDKYLFEETFNEVTATAESIKTTVSVSTSHNLENGDLVKLNIVPNLSVGIGTTASSVIIKVDDNTKNILVNPVGFTSLGISTTTNEISLTNHPFKTGDKVKYNSSVIADGLQVGGYFIFKVDDNTIKLGETFSDVVSTNPRIVSIAGTGGESQTLSLINPEIRVTKNNNLTFDLSDSSLNGYEFKIYHDVDFKNEFVSTGSTSAFSVFSNGTNGQVGASLSITSDNTSPISIFYNIEKSGYISTSDIDVKNYSNIIFDDSRYNKEFKIFGVGSTTFSVYLENNPERFSYSPSECDALEYSTTSKNVKGGINSLNIISSGNNYKKLPTFVGSSSTISENAIVTVSSKEIGNIRDIDFVTDEFKFYTDKTLKPTALLPSIIEIKNSNTINSISVENPGVNYFVPPSLVIVDKVTGEKLNTGFLEPIFETSITGVKILEKPVGLPDSGVVIKSVSNSNGFTIEKIDSTVGTAFTCTLITPIVGFTTSPFFVGDEVYIEGIRKSNSDGTGHNSEDYGYQFLKVKSIPDPNGNPNPNPFRVEFDVVGLTTNTGIAITESNGLGKIIPKNQYPTFNVSLNSSPFISGEKLNVNELEKDLEVVRSNDGELIVFGNDSEKLKIGDKITGRGSLTTGKINKIYNNKGTFNTDFSYKTNVGWEDSIGKLNTDHQVIPDNDYYQNLSYSVKSNQTWKEIKSPVGRLVHTSGLKNFSDTQILSETKISVGNTNTDQSISINDLFDETRVDILRGVDLARDDESNGEFSSFVQFNKTRFVDFVDCRTNNVLSIDNINQQFSNLESSPDRFLNLDIIGAVERYDNYLIRIESFNNSEKQLQFSEFVVLSNEVDHTIFNKSELVNSGENFTNFAEDTFGNYAIETNTEEEVTYLRFIPNDSDNIDYDLKFIKTSVNSSPTGLGTQSIGFIDLTSSNKLASAGTTVQVFSKNIEEIESAYITTKVTDTATKEINFVETYITHDGTDTYISEYYVDAGGESLDNRIGISSASIESSNLIFSYVNDTSNSVKISSKIVGFGTTSAGNGQYRYLVDGQNSGDERTVLYEAFFKSEVGITTIFSGNSLTFDAIKCNVEVSVGSSKALHQITAMHDGNDAYLQQSQFLANNYDSILGLGTFSATYTSNDFIVKFHPEDTTGITSIKTFNQVFYKNIDVNNDPPPLIYGNITESAEFKFYNSVNGDRINKKQFDLKHQNIDIFKKSFNPATVIVAAANTGIGYSAFSVENHFFRTGEELIYTPKSTFVGVGSTPMQYTIDGSSVGVLTSRVFAIRHDDNEFGIATTKAHADSGIGITVTSFGEGNAHTLEMVKSNEKALMAIDGIVQTPISNTNITHTISNNSSPGITTDQTIFALSGISSISIINILKVEDEYMRVDNVGVGTSAIGPITPGIGTFSLVSVERGAVGSSATSHANGALVELYKGNYNIVDSKVNFIEAPRGNPQGQDRNGLPFPRSEFNGRVYFRNNYASNLIYDDISEQFTGITSEFTLTVGGANTAGIGTSGGQGVLFINGIFQTPETDNNPQQNYKIIETFDATVTLSSNYALNVGTTITQFNNPKFEANVINETNSGIVTFQILNGSLNVGIGSTLFANGVDTNVYPTVSSLSNPNATIKFTGMYVDDLERDFISESDVNTNQIPRGGLPISIGSTVGLGYAPLIGAKLRPVVIGGSIVDVVGVATTGASLGIQTALYDNTTGILSVTTTTDHGLDFSNQDKDQVRLVGLAFTYNSGSGSASVVYPTGGEKEYSLLSTPSSKIFEVNIGTSTSSHYYTGGGSVTPFFSELNFGSGYNGIVSVSVAVTETGHSGTEAVITGTPVGFNTYRFISATAGISTGSGALIQPQSGTTYNPLTGILSVTAATHGLSTDDLITIADESLTFSCAQDSFQTLHQYPRSTDYISGISTAITKIDNNTFTVFIGTAPAHGGGRLEFNIVNGGSGYTNPTIFVSEPSYENLSIIGISRKADGLTTNTGVGLRIDAKATPSPDYTGIGSELFEISEFRVSTPGYGFFPGDKFKAVGLVTSRFIESLISEFEMEVTETFTDQFSLWQFGEFDYIDSIAPLQDGRRTRFPLKYEDELISVEANESFNIELNPILLIFRNRVIQEPGKTYEFVGGTTVNFKVAPRVEDDIHIFFYKGTDGEDSSIVQAPPRPVEIGDELKIMGEPNQDNRLISEFTQADTLRTNVYRGSGITTEFESIEIIKQKHDLIIDGGIIDKSRILLEPRINPATKIISDITTTDTQFFIDGVGTLFNYENDSSSINVRITPESINQESAVIVATVSSQGTITGLTINNGGSGYVSTPTVKIQAPPSQIGVGIGSTATATLTISNGSVNGFTITNPGLGYSQSNPPQVIVSEPEIITEIVTNITSVKGSSGIITAIESTTIGSDKAVKFALVLDSDIASANSEKPSGETGFDTSNLFVVGNPVFIYDTEVGTGVTSINGNDSEVVGIGTTCLDNIYIIQQFSSTGEHPNPIVGILTCKVISTTDMSNIPTTVGYSTDPIGKFAMGLVKGTDVARSTSPISIGVTGFTVNSGLSSFPTVQRIGGDQTFFNTGAITK